MQFDGTLLLSRSDVRQLLTLSESIGAIEKVFRLQGEGKIPASGILGIKTREGGLHVKVGFLPGERDFIVAKLNTNFPGNQARFGLPTIQGVILVSDAANGLPLAVLDSIDITIKRTAAATAVAAKCLARNDSSVATICGCGEQGRAQLPALLLMLPIKTVYAFDLNDETAESFARDFSRELKIGIDAVRALPSAIRRSDVVVTCTTAKQLFVNKADVAPGTFIAAVGADDAHKQEIDPALLARVKVVADSLEQCCAIGDTHHAITRGLMRKEDVYAELAEIVAGGKPGRTHDVDIIVFDSTGVAIEDAVVAAAVYEKARASAVRTHFQFAA